MAALPPNPLGHGEGRDPAGRGLLVSEFSIDPPFERDIGPFHSREHVPERLALTSVGVVRRYVSLDDPLHFLALYRMADPEVFASPAWRAIQTNPSPETDRVLAGVHGTRFIGEIVREAGLGYGGLLCRHRFATPPDGDAELRRWFDASVDSLMERHGIVRILLAQPRRDDPDVSDPNWILTVEGYGEESLRMPLSRAPGEAESRLFRLEHLFA